MSAFLKWFFKIILTGLSSVLILWPFSPKPMCWFVRNLFRFGIIITPKNYASVCACTKTIRDLCYDPAQEKGYLDIVLPTAGRGALPVIFWLHGGAYVGGDKNDVAEYMVMIAERGYAVVNINYVLAPEAYYPASVLCIPKAYEFIRQHADEYALDLSRVYFAGDSAGAQMAAQFVTAQVDAAYAKQTGISQVVSFATIKGTAFFCGFYDVPAYVAIFHPYSPASYAINRIFWGVTGVKDWANDGALMEASVLHHVPAAFPPTFLTDGNTATFTEQAMAYASALKGCGVQVTDVFYPRDEVRLCHEYQFKMRGKAAQKTFARFLEFLEQTKK